ncbi:MAG TPA: hypothetical protein VGC99_29215, partial [Candidatus Tectomicrobia bacterium]
LCPQVHGLPLVDARQPSYHGHQLRSITIDNVLLHPVIPQQSLANLQLASPFQKSRSTDLSLRRIRSGAGMSIHAKRQW